MSVNKTNPLMPRAGSRALRVLLELANYTQPVREDVLMAAVRLGNMSPTFWRQGPFKSLVSSGLIERCDNGCWLMTPRGREVVAQCPAAPRKKAEPEALAAVADTANMAWPRSVPPFRPMKPRASWRDTVVREGAFDYCDIPSLHSGRPATAALANITDNKGA